MPDFTIQTVDVVIHDHYIVIRWTRIFLSEVFVNEINDDNKLFCTYLRWSFCHHSFFLQES